MSDITDKLLIVLLITVLPLSIFTSSRLQESSQSQLEEKTRQQEQQLDQVVNSIQSVNTAKDAKTSNPITIEAVTYATASGELKVSGIAPQKNINVMVSAIVSPLTPKLQADAIASNSAHVASASADETTVLGEAVEVLAVKANETGQFTFIKKVDKEKTDSIELHLDQDDSTAVIQYSVSQNKRTL